MVTHRFLATDVRPSPPVKVDVKVVARAACILTNETSLVRLKQCQSVTDHM